MNTTHHPIVVQPSSRSRFPDKVQPVYVHSTSRADRVKLRNAYRYMRRSGLEAFEARFIAWSLVGIAR